jgi:hypothetical protein
MRVAYIAALFGVVGTLIGSAITYVSNRAVQNQQISQQNAVEARATRAAARLAVYRYAAYDTLAAAMLADHTYIVQELPSPLSPADEALVVGSLSTNGLNALGLADEGLGFVTSVRKDGRAGAPLQVGDQYKLRTATDDIEKALAVLKQMATRRLS